MDFPEYHQSEIDPQTIEAELTRSFNYFRTLNLDLKNSFVERTSIFIQQKKFVARQDLKMTDTVRIIISACAVQVTFGLDSFILDTFEYVVVYPNVYESPVTGKMHKGEINLSGFICFSWKHIIEGIENPYDNYNLGIHEWTHALRFNSINYDQTDYFFDGYIIKWVANAMPEYSRLKNGRQSIFRRYGATNIHEFLSVCTEHFFESPDEFKLKTPQFFDEMCILFNQIPGKEKPTQLFVRNKLLKGKVVSLKDEVPVLVLEASFYRTIVNLGLGLVYFSIALIVLLLQANVVSTILVFLLCLWGVIILNNKFFTIKFYENSIYLQSGFINLIASKLNINYNSLIKLEIYAAGIDSDTGTAFQLNYYDGSKFRKRTAYCSTIDVPYEKIIPLLKQKKVNVLWPN